MRRPVTACLVACCIAVAAACGGGDDGGRRYEEGLQAATAALRRDLVAVGRRIPAQGTGPEVGAQLDAGVRALDRAVRATGELDPPGDAQAAHERYVAALRAAERVFRGAAEAARREDLEAVTRALAELDRGRTARALSAAQDELRRRGYDAEPGRRG